MPEASIRIVGDEAVGLECFATPGHASHHVCFAHEDGTIYAGDARASDRAEPAVVLPPTSPDVTPSPGR